MTDLGILFDVDGPLASPVSRTIRIPAILDDLVALVAAGVPVAFITGRSDGFVRDSVIAPLFAVGLADALAAPGARMFGVFEKGGAWAPITTAGIGEVTVDETVGLPLTVIDGVRRLVEERFAETMFFDEGKLAMISVEQRTDVDSAHYLRTQPSFNDAAFELLAAAGLGVSLRDRVALDAQGTAPFRLDPTIISTDIESILLDKDRGAERAVAYFAELGELPKTWRTVGDSRGDYLMADHLHSAGFDVAHLDVRPADGILKRPYRIITEGELIHDEATAVFLEFWIKKLGLR